MTDELHTSDGVSTCVHPALSLEGLRAAGRLEEPHPIGVCAGEPLQHELCHLDRRHDEPEVRGGQTVDCVSTTSLSHLAAGLDVDLRARLTHLIWGRTLTRS